MSSDLLSRLNAAVTDEDREWAVLEFSLQAIEPAVTEAVWAASVPMWFEQDFLAALLEKSKDETAAIFETLTSLTFVESFPGRGYNIHERSRKALLRHLWQDDRERYQTLNRLAARYCEQQDQTDLAWRIETIYHRLLAAGDDTADSELEFVNQIIDWQNRYQYEKAEALIRPILIEANAGRLTDKTLGWAESLYADQENVLGRFASAKDRMERVYKLNIDDQFLKAKAAQVRGTTMLGLDDYDRALEFFESAKELYAGNEFAQANAVYNKGLALLGLDQYQSARQEFEKTHELYKNASIPSLSGQATCLEKIGDSLIGQAFYQEARSKYEDAMKFYSSDENRRGETFCLRRLADVDFVFDDHPAAEKYAMTALEMSKQTESLLDRAGSLQILGRLSFTRDQYKVAREQFEEAEVLLKRVGERLNTANCIQMLADVLLAQGDPEARKRIEQALHIYEAIHSRLGQGCCLWALGNADAILGEYDSAREHYQHALDLNKQIGNRMGHANCLWSLGNVGIVLGDQHAREHFVEAGKLYEEAQIRTGGFACIVGLTQLSEQQQDWKTAVQAYQRAFDYFRKIGMPFNAALIGARLCLAARKAGDTDKAQETHKLVLDLLAEIDSPGAARIRAELDSPAPTRPALFLKLKKPLTIY